MAGWVEAQNPTKEQHGLSAQKLFPPDYTRISSLNAILI